MRKEQAWYAQREANSLGAGENGMEPGEDGDQGEKGKSRASTRQQEPWKMWAQERPDQVGLRGIRRVAKSENEGRKIRSS